jgi:prepilin-type processing-associated H-X9-DG protein
MILGILVLIVLSMWAWLSMWGLYRVRRELCAVNLISIRSCLHPYMNDYEGQLPTGQKWCDLLIEEADEPKSDFRCPGDSEGPGSYAMNQAVYRYTTWGEVPRDMVMVFESEPGWNRVGGRVDLTTRYHRGRGCMVLFADGYVFFVGTKELSGLRWD